MAKRVEKRGVLPIQDLRRHAENGEVFANAPLLTAQFQPNSIDLRLGPLAYRTRCSFLPVSGSPSPTSKLIDEFTMYPVDIQHGYVFECNQTYLIPLMEGLALPQSIWGATNPKSSAGRLDMLARVITEHGHMFDHIPHGYRGKLYLDLMVRSFPIKLRAGDTLVQLRLLTGKHVVVPDDELRALLGKQNLVLDAKGVPIPSKDLQVEDGVLLTVKLRGQDDRPVGYVSRKTNLIVDYAAEDHSIHKYWRSIRGRPSDRIILEPEEFYIFSSNERVRIPENMCAEMVAFDVRSGEVRTHYAGFFDSGFGMTGAGANVVLEVRNRDMPFLVQHGQRLFRLKYFWNTERPESVYGADGFRSHYQGQDLRLAKQFKPKEKLVQRPATEKQLSLLKF